MILKLILGVTIPDVNAPFLLMTGAYLTEYLAKLPVDYNLLNVMLMTYGVYYHRKILFVDISFQPRQKGTNSLNLKKITKIGIHAIRDFRQLRTQM